MAVDRRMNSAHYFILFLRLLLTFTFLFSLSCSTGENNGRHGGFNVLLISVDGLGGDMMGMTSDVHSRNRFMPMYNLSKQAAKGISAVNGFSHTNAVLPAAVSLLTSTNVSDHGTRMDHPLNASIFLGLDAFFRKSDYATCAVVSDTSLTRFHGVGTWFEDYFDIEIAPPSESSGIFPDRDAVHTTDLAIRWIDKQGKRRPFFLWVEYADLLSSSLPVRTNITEIIPSAGKTDNSEGVDSENAFTEKTELVDREIGRLLARIYEDPDLEMSTIVVVTSGFSLTCANSGNSGENQHGIDRFSWKCFHVPITISVAGRIHRNSIIDRPVSTLDIAPTILDLNNYPVPGYMRGEILTPFLSGGFTTDPRAVRIEDAWGKAFGIIRGGWKLEWKTIEEKRREDDTSSVITGFTDRNMNTIKTDKMDNKTDNSRLKVPEKPGANASIWKEHFYNIELDPDEEVDFSEETDEIGLRRIHDEMIDSFRALGVAMFPGDNNSRQSITVNGYEG